MKPMNDSSLTYTWIPQNGLSDPSIANPYAYPTQTTKYRLLLSNKICTDTIYQTVNVNTLLLIPLKDTTVCKGSNITLTVHAKSNNKVQYQWSSSDKFIDTLNLSLSDSSALIKNISNHTYYVKVTNQYCPYLEDSIHVTAIPQISVSNDTTICKGDSIILKVMNNDLPDTTTYSWQPSNYILQTTNINQLSTIKVNPPVTTTFYVTATCKNGCKATDSITVKVTNINTDAIVKEIKCYEQCSGSIKLFPSGGAAPYSYNWSNGINIDSVSKLCPGKYTVTITDLNGCKHTNEYIFISPSKISMRISDQE